MQEVLQAFSEIQNDVPWRSLFAAVVFVIIAQAILKVFDSIFHLIIANWKEKTRALSARKFFIYFYNLCLFFLFLKICQVTMQVVLGATGLLTLAIGFAARTPISNLISGFFLVFERPFVVGNIIEIDNVKGEVVSRNLLSLTIRTLDNVMMRIPNEQVIGSLVSNNSFFPIRRFDLTFLISSRESLSRVEGVFKSVASRNVMALDEPLPYFYVNAFRENHIEVIFRIWCSSEDFLTFQSEFPKEILRAVRSAGVEPIRQSVEVLNPSFKFQQDKQTK